MLIEENNHEPFCEIEEWKTKQHFKRLNCKKGAGPDGVSPRLLSLCSDQLACVFTMLFNWSLKECKVPCLYKKATIIPVPKRNNIVTLNDYRPVAITSCVMKVFERLVLVELKKLLPNDHDPLQFAYRKNRSVDDAVSVLLHSILQHLEKKDSYARVLFIDFSSAFNTIIPSRMYKKTVGLLPTA